MVAIHAVESGVMAEGRLRRHTVPVGGKLWWKWMASTFLEGAGAMARFDGEVEEIKRRREKAAH